VLLICTPRGHLILHPIHKLEQATNVIGTLWIWENTSRTSRMEWWTILDSHSITRGSLMKNR
jgi:hypothetical protein